MPAANRSFFGSCAVLRISALVVVAFLLPPWLAPCQPILQAADADAKQHPLAPEIEKAERQLAELEKTIKDYSCNLVKRERVNGTLGEHQTIFTRIRHQPFSVYMYFMAPEDVKGQQVVYIEGKNDGNLIAQPIGVLGKLGPYFLPPDGMLAMKGQRYPITTVGMLNLIRRIIEVGRQDQKHSDIVVNRYEGAKVGDRICTVTEIVHPVKREHFRYFKARIFVDDKLDLPIRFESYSWPEKEGGEPVLLEEYTYTDIQLNNEFTDDHFKIRE